MDLWLILFIIFMSAIGFLIIVICTICTCREAFNKDDPDAGWD